MNDKRGNTVDTETSRPDGRAAEPRRTAPCDWVVERRGDGALLVRVPSTWRGAETLPDAVFAFQSGDPQYAFWEQELARRGASIRGEAQSNPANPAGMAGA